MTPEQKLVQYLSDAHAIEAALVQTLTAHVAVTPRGEYRSLLERHLSETRQHATRLEGRIAELGEGRNPLQLAYALAETIVGQVIAAGKLPVDLLRGGGGEEKLLRNARDEAASEALEIATYDALEALATAAGDEETANLAREHRAQEEAFLEQLRAQIPELARDMLEAEDAEGGSFDVTAVAKRARSVAEEVRSQATGGAGDGDEEDRAEEPADLPIEDYADLPVERILPKLRLLSEHDLAEIQAFERDHRGRKRVLNRIDELRGSTNGRH